MIFSILLIFFLFNVTGKGLEFRIVQEYNTLLESVTLPFTTVDVDVPSQISQREALDTRIRWLIQVQGPISNSWKKLMNNYLASRKTTLGHYFPQNTFLVTGTSDFRSFLSAGPGVMGVIRYRKDFKIALALSKFFNQIKIPSNFISITLRVQLFLALETKPKDNSIVTSVVTDFSKWLVATFTVSQRMDVTFHAVSTTNIEVKIKRFPFIKQIAIWFSGHNDVDWIEEKLVMSTSNYYDTHTLQGDTNDVLPLTQKGLTGEGVIIGIGDSGIDYDLCFFNDPNVAVPINKTSDLHRKIFYYYAWQGQGDYSGHGTHVCGTAVGNIENPTTDSTKYLSNFNGVAPAAKLAFIQLGRATGGDIIYVPNQISDYFDWLRINGQASISSNSWGNKDNHTYEDFSLAVDKYMWENPDFLIIFAAGNAGSVGLGPTRGLGTIGVPALAKNSITVGGSVNGPEGSLLFLPSNINTSIAFATYNPNPIHSFQNISFEWTDPTSACSAITNNLTGLIGIIDNTGCSSIIKTQNVQNAGALFVIIVSNDNNIVSPDGTPSVAFTIGTAMIRKSLRSTILNSNSLSLEIHSIRKLATWSAHGPTDDGRFKPDIIAPGLNVMSANSDKNLNTFNQCNSITNSIKLLSGTSMSTPGVAGMAALVTQYYKMGYYPSGLPTRNSLIPNPTSALIKATILASGTSLVGTMDDNGLKVTGWPDVMQGYGKAQLDTVLKLTSNDPNITDTPKVASLWVLNSQSIDTLDRHSYCFRVYPNSQTISPSSTVKLSSLKATLVWTDYYPSLASSVKLINNIDLAVIRINDGKVWLGNNLSNGTWDSLNNVEQIVIPDDSVTSIRGSYFAVVVYGENIPQATQNYAVVVNGNFIKVNESNCGNTAAFCPNWCSASDGGGTCDTTSGKCVCIDSRAGTGCQLSNKLLQSSGDYQTNGSLSQSNYNYFYFIVTPEQMSTVTTGLTIQVTVPSPLSTPQSFGVFFDVNKVPTVAKYASAVYSKTGFTKWTSIIQMATLPAAGGRFCFAVYNFCCSSNTYSIMLTLA